MQTFERDFAAGVWVVEYSKKQGCFHVDTLDRTTSKNRQAFLRGADHGFATIGLFRTQEAATRYAQQAERTIDRTKG